MKCATCKEEILQSNAPLCPYCGSRNLVSDEQVDQEDGQASRKEAVKNREGLLERAGKLERAGRYEDAAKKYEELDMWDKAGDCRRMAKTNYVVSANVNIGKVGTISMECPFCGASQPIATKSNEVICKFCGKNYVIPKRVLDLL